MNLQIQMKDCETGEVLYNQHKILACQFHKNDVAFNLMHRVLESCVRGIRFKHIPAIDLQIRFSEDEFGNSPELPFEPQSQYKDFF